MSTKLLRRKFLDEIYKQFVEVAVPDDDVDDVKVIPPEWEQRAGAQMVDEPVPQDSCAEAQEEPSHSTK